MTKDEIIARIATAEGELKVVTADLSAATPDKAVSLEDLSQLVTQQRDLETKIASLKARLEEV